MLEERRELERFGLSIERNFTRAKKWENRGKTHGHFDKLGTLPESVWFVGALV
jgi:hypothetical protein